MQFCLLDPGTLVDRDTLDTSIGHNIRDCYTSQLAMLELRCLETGDFPSGAQKRASLALGKIIHWGRGVPYSYGLLQLAALLRKHGVDVQYINVEALTRGLASEGNALSDALFDHLLPKRVVFCLTGMTPSFPFVVRLAGMLRRLRSESTIVLGGPHASFAEITHDERKCFDVIIRGEGENALCALLEQDAQSVSEMVPDCIVLDASRFPPVDGQDIPLPAYELLLDNDITTQQFGTLMATRGCRYACRYCVEGRLFGRKIRHRPIDDVILEVRLQNDFFGTSHFYFLDSTLDNDVPYLLEMCKRLSEECANMTFAGNVQPLNATPSTIEAMLKAGFTSFFMGIENLANPVLQRMGRPTFERLHRSLRQVFKSEAGFVGGTVMFGFPGDAPRHAALTIQRARALIEEAYEAKTILHMNPAIFTPYPGTPPHSHPSQYGLRLLPADYSSYNRFTPVHVLDTMSEQQMLDAYNEFAAAVLATYSSFIPGDASNDRQAREAR